MKQIIKMKKNTISIYIISILFIAFFACEKDVEKVTLPKVTTASVDEITNTSARIGGKVEFDGGAKVTDRGIYWGTSTKPDSTGTKLEIGTETGVFYDTLTGLTQGVKYYVKAYATNSLGTAYGVETFFTTQIFTPTITTLAVTDVTPSSATVGGNITDDGGFEVTQRGIYWGTDTNAVLTGKKVLLGSGIGEFTTSLTGLSKGITYYVIPFATNIKGTSYGEEISFSTENEIPTVYTTTVSGITGYSATVGGNVSVDGGSEVTERGIYWGTSTSPQTSGTQFIIGSGTGIYSDSLGNLDPATEYYVVAYATNSLGTAYGDEKTFTTLGEVPTVSILEYLDLTSTGVTLQGLVSANDLSTVVTFEYGTTDAYGSYVTADNSPVTENDDTVTGTITGLTPETVYHYRITAVNDLGTVSTEDSTFTTVITGITGTVDDIDGNTYQTIGIGYQEWMTENLKTTKYNNGSDIPLIENDSAWEATSSAGFCWYNNDSSSYKDVYGGLYNWEAVNTGNLCPTGWHVPTNDELTELVDYLGSANEAGGLLKETGTSHWKSPNTGATDQYSFTALPGGKRDDLGSFSFMTIDGNWWTSTSYSALYANYIYMLYDYPNSFQAYIKKKYGLSVRCVKD